MDYLTEEELFELQHQDEMDAMDELDIANEIECMNYTSRLFDYKSLIF